MVRNNFSFKIKRLNKSLLIYFFLFHTLFNSKIMSSYNQLLNKNRILAGTISNVYSDKKARISTFSSTDNAEETTTDNKYIFQLTIKGTIQNTNSLSMIDLDQCKNILNNNAAQPLIILKLEKLTNLIYEKNVQYEIYDPTTKNKYDISKCENNPIFLYIPINMNQNSQLLYEDLKKNQYNFFNMNDPFYQDICTPYKSKDDTDVLLSDRRKDYFIKEVTPQSNCEYVDYSSDKKYLKFKCKVDKESIDISKIDKFSGESSLTNFNKDLKILNLKVLKCYKLILNMKTITKNFGSIIVIALIIFNISFAIIFIIKGISPLKLNIARYLFEKPKKNNNNTNQAQLNYPPKKKLKQIQ